MSYVRRGPDSDVYVFQNMQEKYECHFCSIVKEPDRGPENLGFETALASVMIDHLLKHRARGQKVPERAIEALRRCVDHSGDPVSLLRDIGSCWGRMKSSRPDLVGRLPAKLRTLLDRADSYEQRRTAAAPEPE